MLFKRITGGYRKRHPEAEPKNLEIHQLALLFLRQAQDRQDDLI